jgi:hypothetical protein
MNSEQVGVLGAALDSYLHSKGSTARLGAYPETPATQIRN